MQPENPSNPPKSGAGSPPIELDRDSRLSWLDSWRQCRIGLSVMIVCGALIYGLTLRSRVDLPIPEVTPSVSSSLMASNDPKANVVGLLPYYDRVEELLRQKYVAPDFKDSTLAYGSIEAMVNSLDDPDSKFFYPDQYSLFTAAQSGDYQGIGIDLKSRLTSPQKENDYGGVSESELSLDVPELVVQDIAPDSSAAKAGVLPGDVVYSVDGHWVVNPLVVKRLGQLPRPIKSPSKLAKIAKIQTQKLQDLLDSEPISPTRASVLVTTGTKGSVMVVWQRGDKLISTNLVRGQTNTLETAVEPGGAIRLRFDNKAADFLLNHFPKKGYLTIDLRNQSNGSFECMTNCLDVVCGTTELGYIRLGPSHHFIPLESNGTRKIKNIHLIVDKTTNGAAAIFALALKKFCGAVWWGKGVGSDLNYVRFFELDHGGFITLDQKCILNLSVGTYQTDKSSTPRNLSNQLAGKVAMIKAVHK